MRRSPEKAVEKAGDELMAAFGFTAIRFSQSRATMQTAGIPDRRYYAVDGLALHYGLRPIWWEAKAPGGKQSAAQRWFQLLVEQWREVYVCGGVEALQDWFVETGVARRVPGGIEGIRRSA